MFKRPGTHIRIQVLVTFPLCSITGIYIITPTAMVVHTSTLGEQSAHTGFQGLENGRSIVCVLSHTSQYKLRSFRRQRITHPQYYTPIVRISDRFQTYAPLPHYPVQTQE